MTDETGPGDEATATHQPTLPDLELPEYHGAKPVGMRTTVSGTGNRLTRPHGIGDRFVLVVEVKCNASGHKDIDDALYYFETAKAMDMFELDRDAGTRLLRHLRSTYQLDVNRAKGIDPLPDAGIELIADGSGVVLTDAEIAERRGQDPILSILTDDESTPVVAIYTNGMRLLWPDEYDAGEARPSIGEPCKLDDGEVDEANVVVELVHHATGETIAVAPGETEKAIAYFGGEGSAPSEEAIAAWEGDPTDHRPDADDGGYSDVPPYEAPAAGAPPAPPLPGEEDLEARLPTSVDFTFVNVPVPELRRRLEDNAPALELADLRRILEAEKQGRGEGHKPRRGALDAIHKAIAARTS